MGRTRRKRKGRMAAPGPIVSPVDHESSGRVTWPAVILLGAVTIVVLLPFLGKALHIDDPLFVWSAQQIHRSPLDFYGFDVNWYGHPEPMADVTQNPPGASYFLALSAMVLGWSETALHGAFLIPALAVTIGTMFLARRFCSRPLLAGVCVIATPVFMMSGTVLTSDLVMLAFWTWAIELWLRGHEQRSPIVFAGSALLVAAAALTKYFAVALIPLLLVDAWVRGRRRAMIWMVLPAVVLGLYELATRSLYGHGLLSQAGGYTRYIAKLDQATAIAPLGKALVGFVFFGGCTFLVLLLAPWLWTRTQLVIGSIVALLASLSASAADDLYGFPMTDADGFKWWIIVHLFVFLAAGLGTLGLPCVRLLRAPSADSLLLGLWVLGTFLFAAVLNWTVNGRSVLPAVPAVAILLVQRLDRHVRAGKKRIAHAAIAAGLLVALAVAWADLRHANTAREAADRATEYDGGSTDRIRYQGHWGFQWYMEQHGARALNLNSPVLTRGEFVVLPGNNTEVRELPRQGARLLERLELPTTRWVSTMSPFEGTGYYAARKRGPLPFALRPTTPERYYVYRVIRNINHPSRPAGASNGGSAH